MFFSLIYLYRLKVLIMNEIPPPTKIGEGYFVTLIVLCSHNYGSLLIQI